SRSWLSALALCRRYFAHLPYSSLSSSSPFLLSIFSLRGYVTARVLHFFPTRRSSDLACQIVRCCPCSVQEKGPLHTFSPENQDTDRKSTRLNSSHVSISYAVFCLKKKRERIELRSLPGRRWMTALLVVGGGCRRLGLG